MQKRVTFEGSLEYDEENFDGELTDKQAAEIAQNTVAENPQIVGFDIETVEEDEQEAEAEPSGGDSVTTEIATDTLATILEAARREYDSMEECHAPETDTEPLLDAINTADEAIKSDEDRSPLEDLISVDGQTLSIASPTQSEHDIEWIDIDIEPLCENVNGDSILLDYYHGRPVMYFWEPGSEDAKHTIAPAVPEDEATRLIHCNHSIMEQNEQRVTGSAD
jgi:hypothetical protein